MTHVQLSVERSESLVCVSVWLYISCQLVLILNAAELVKPASEAATSDIASLPVIHESDEHGLSCSASCCYYHYCIIIANWLFFVSCLILWLLQLRLGLPNMLMCQLFSYQLQTRPDPLLGLVCCQCLRCSATERTAAYYVCTRRRHAFLVILTVYCMQTIVGCWCRSVTGDSWQNVQKASSSWKHVWKIPVIVVSVSDGNKLWIGCQW